jgi:DNA polymerase-1
MDLWRAFSEAWEPLKTKLIQTIDADYGIYDGTSFRVDRFVDWLDRAGLDWPFYPSGQPQLDSDTFREQARTHAIVGPLHELRSTTAKLRLTGLAIGADGRNRTLLSPFGASSGRNTPSNSKFIFGPAVWMRGLIRPPPNHAVVYIDWAGQEIAIAAALSQDERMIEGYRSGDPHMAFAKANRLAPPEATSLTHPVIRESCKTVNLGVNYGMTAVGLALRLGITPAAAQELLRLHHETYRRFWAWSEETVSSALLSNRMTSLFGWQLHVTAGVNARSLQNFPMQANGAEMMRIAAIGATEAGLSVACPVHDAFVLVAPLDRLDEDIATMREIMRRAGLAVTAGRLEVRTDVKVVRHPGRYMDNRGVAMWSRATSLLREVCHNIRSATRAAGCVKC